MFRRLLALLALCSLVGVMPNRVFAEETCFPSDKTPYCFDNAFAGYWNDNGGLPVFGYPITKAANELNRDTEVTYWTQWAERNRFEVHPENSGTPYEILLGRLGADRLAQLGRVADTRESGPQANCLWFETTGHNVCNQSGSLGFKTYWETHGLNIPGLDNYARSLQLFGFPLTEPRMETNSSGDTVLTQWFERARFEWHPQNPDDFKVLLGLLGREVYDMNNQPDPGKIVFVSDKTGNSEIYTMAPDGTEMKQLTQTSAAEISPSWSPDKTKIAFIRYEGIGSNLYIMNADGTGVVKLSNDNALDAEPSWSPNSKKIAFVSYVDRTYKNDLFIIDADGKNRTRVASTEVDEIHPNWSPDGGSLAFITRLDDSGSATDIYSINLTSKALTRLTNDNWTEYELEWSPNGSKLAFSAYDGDGVTAGDIATGNIYTINNDGSGRTALTSDNGRNPSWSPQGNHLTYSYAAPNANGIHIYTMNSDGTNRQKLTNTGNNIFPNWSR